VGFIALGFAFPGSANGRLQYYGEFADKYADKKKLFEAMKCGVCHGENGANKKNRNDYGTAFDKALGGKNVKDKERIQKALKEAESKLPF
jgi:cytochrome c